MLNEPSKILAFKSHQSFLVADFLQLKFPSGAVLPITFHMRIIYGLFRKYYGGWYPVSKRSVFWKCLASPDTKHVKGDCTVSGTFAWLDRTFPSIKYPCKIKIIGNLLQKFGWNYSKILSFVCETCYNSSAEMFHLTDRCFVSNEIYYLCYLYIVSSISAFGNIQFHGHF